MSMEEDQNNPGIESMGNNVENGDNNDIENTTTQTEDLFSQASADPSPGSQERQLGLNIHKFGWSGSSYDDYDVITVHGIRDDYKTAWIDKEGYWWVRRKLFKNLSIRQIDYAYEIDQDSKLYDGDGIRQHAIKLIGQYAMIRKELEALETESDRPIIWICHDLGGTIVKEALSMAMSSPKKYGKIAILTTAIIFLGTPHRFNSPDDLEDQLHKLVHLPGPVIRNRPLKKVKSLADQVRRVNRDFLATKLLDRAIILNVLVQYALEGPKEGQIDSNQTHTEKNEGNISHSEMEAPFPRFAHTLSHSFEAAGRIRLDQTHHSRLAMGDEEDPWPTCGPGMFNADGSPIKVNYRYINLQASILAIAPPTRILNTVFDPLLPKHPAVSWIHQHKTFTEFDRPLAVPKMMHLYSNGNPLIDISEISQNFYVDYDASRVVYGPTFRTPANSVVYFEFDRWDSRYNNISSMLSYFSNVLMWRFWPTNPLVVGQLEFLVQAKACSVEDLFHLFYICRDLDPPTHKLTFFISCFDQCPEDQRKWFLERIMDKQGYADGEFRVIISTTHQSDLAVGLLPENQCINLQECPAFNQPQFKDELTQEFRIAVNDLIARRPIYENFQLQIQSQLNECLGFPHLGRIILTWLSHYGRGIPKSEIAKTINKLSPVTVENTIQVFISSLNPERRQKARNIFNWVKHAAEPWTPESLAEAIAVYECAGEDLCLDDLDYSGFVIEIEREFGGMITLKNRDIQFSHASFYELTEVGVEGTDEWAAFVNSQIATTCLNYFRLRSAQEKLSEICPENLEGGPWETGLDAAVINHRQTSMAEYAVRFWPQHYKASGEFKPTKLVNELFSDRKSLAAWKVPFYTLSNPFTRLQRSYISPLPTFAMLGLDDLVDEQLETKRDEPFFQRDCSLAITEAARAGNTRLVQLLLEAAGIEQDELPNALFWAAAYGKGDAVDILLETIPDIKTFRWPEYLMYRAATISLKNILAVMQRSGRDINEFVHEDWKGSSLVAATWWNQISAVKFMLELDPKPDLSLGDKDGDDPIWYASMRGDPRMIEVLLQAGATVDKNDSPSLGLVQTAIQWRNHKALELLIAARADLTTGSRDENADFYTRPPLVVASDVGSVKCVRLLLRGGANPNVECDSGTALYAAVSGNHIDIARMLLENDPKADVNVSPPNKDKLMIKAVCTGNTELVSLLIDHGAAIEFVDPNGVFSKTPLSRAASGGDMEMVKLLIDKGADVNYTEEKSSDSPLFSAIYRGKAEVAKLLLEKDVDVTWAASDNWNSLHAAYNLPEVVPDLLQKGVDIDGESQHGTVLQMAARYNTPKTITILLKHTPKPNLELVYSGSLIEDVGCTALLLACKHLNPECVKLLLEAGANPHFQKEDGDDAIDILLREEEGSDNAEKCLKLLVSKPYEAGVHNVDKEGNTLLHKIEKYTTASIVQILVKANVPLNETNNDGYTPLAIAVNKGNLPAAKCLIEHGADVNVFNPRFGSILHIACANGSLDLVKILLSAGADKETVDPGYGESLLYTALGVEGKARVQMVRYLVDEAKVPINQRGGVFAYPIIRAAHMAESSHSFSAKILKFLIHRKANLDVADDQGRRAVHLASNSWWEHSLQALLDAGADVNVKDKVGRLPIHFAASCEYIDCTEFLLNRFGDERLNAADDDGWTPLMWAARSGDNQIITRLMEREADVWARSRAGDAESEWSALKLARFTDRSAWYEELTPKERIRHKPGGGEERWDDAFHESKIGDLKGEKCSSCFVKIRGTQWECIECTTDFFLCFKCYGHRYELHDAEHNFQEIGPFFQPVEPPHTQIDPPEDDAGKERAESPERGSRNGEESALDGEDANDDANAATSPDETVDDIEFDIEIEDE